MKTIDGRVPPVGRDRASFRAKRRKNLLELVTKG
jgi:hypothetical protein